MLAVPPFRHRREEWEELPPEPATDFRRGERAEGGVASGAWGRRQAWVSMHVIPGGRVG
jgi:hypothetical protein